MELHKVLIVNAPTGAYDPSGNQMLFPAVGVISLATHLKNEYPNFKIKVLDGGISSTENIKREIDYFKPSILAISVVTPSYKEGLKVARYAKENYGSTIILGNDHASFFPDLILKKRSFVDFVVKGDVGEIMFSNLIGWVTGKEKKLLSDDIGDDGVFYRNKKQIKRTHLKNPSLKDVYKTKKDIPDLAFIKSSYNSYKENYNLAYKKFHDRYILPITFNTARGCKNWTKRCLYCSIYCLKPRWTDVEYFWQVIKEYHNNYGINLFFEVTDEFLAFKEFIKKVIKEKPFDLKRKGIEMQIYARADELIKTPKTTLKILKELNITRVNLGLDSGDNRILKLLRKNLKTRDLDPVEINYAAVKFLAENNISIHASFPLGCIGETKQSLNNTLFFIKKICNDFGKHIATIEVAELLPMPHSVCWDLLLGKQKSRFYKNLSVELKKADIEISCKTHAFLREKYENKDIYNLNTVVFDWIKYFTKVNFSDIQKAKKEIKKLVINIGAQYGRAI